MKLTVELTQNAFKYTYEIGESRHTSECPLVAEGVFAFAHILEMCSRNSTAQHEEWKRKTLAKAYAEKPADEKE